MSLKCLFHVKDFYLNNSERFPVISGIARMPLLAVMQQKSMCIGHVVSMFSPSNFLQGLFLKPSVGNWFVFG
jgi:hypothetical protein